MIVSPFKIIQQIVMIATLSDSKPSKYLSHDMTKPTKKCVHPAKTQISLGIRPVWSECSLRAQWVAKDQAFFMRTAKTLIRLGGCPGWSESSLDAQPFCWFCHVAAHLFYCRYLQLAFDINVYWKALKTHNFLILGSRMHIVFTYCLISLEPCFCHFSNST